MNIEFLCSNPECRTKLEVGDELAGKKVRCPKCKTVMIVPRRRDLSAGSAQAGELPACPPSDEAEAEPLSGYEATMELEESPEEEEQPEEGGVAALEAELEQTRRPRLPYQAQKELARGGMGAIILARDKAIQRELAVKVMRPQIADSEEHRLRFLEEAQVTGQLEHPNIVPIHELGKDADGNLYFTMKLVKGKSLGEILKELKSVGEGEYGSMGDEEAERPADARAPTHPHTHTPTLPDLLGVFLKVCDGIAFAHSKGVIHRDLKPDNIMVGEFGEVQIMDWGLAKVVGASCQLAASREQVSGVRCQTSDEDQDEQSGSSDLKPETRNLKPDTPEPRRLKPDASAIQDESAIRKADTVRSVRSESDVALTVDGQITGTPAYMPPEQAEGKLEWIDHRSDVYSLGAILYEILTLERPIEGDTVHKVLLNVSDGKITPPEQRTPDRGIPRELSAVVMKAMSKSRRKRYQSVMDLGQDIKRFLEGRSVSAKEDSLTETVVKLVKRNRGVSIATGIAAALLVVVVGVSFVRISVAKNRAVLGERKALDAQKQLRDNAVAASEELAEQAVRAIGEGRVAEASIRAEAAAKMASFSPWGLYAQGKVAAAKSEYEQAEARFRAALKIDPEHGPSKTALAGVLGLGGKLEEALALIESKEGKKDWFALKEAGERLRDASKHRESLRAFKESLAHLDKPTRVPEGEKSWRRVVETADALLAQQLYPDASASYRKAIEMMQKGSVPTGWLSKAQSKLKEAEDGLAELKAFLEDRRDNEEAWVKCEDLYALRKELPAEEYWQRVLKKFEELHGQKVRAECEIEEGVIRSVSLASNIYAQRQPLQRYIQPLHGLALKRVDLGTHGYGYRKGISDLTPLRGMPLELLSVEHTSVVDLGPLRGMPLKELDLSRTKVNDLSPLQGMPLQTVKLYGCADLADLGPLAGAKLRSLDISGTKVTDLGPLKGMPLSELVCCVKGIGNLAPLVGMPLERLDLGGAAEVNDITPLHGMPLKWLSLYVTPVVDIGPLKGAPLEFLNCMGWNVRVTDWTPLKGMPLKELAIGPVEDISPLAGLPLQKLTLDGFGGKSLDSLEGMELVYLKCKAGSLTDISALAGMPLEEVDFRESHSLSDIGPLRGMALSSLGLMYTSVSNLPPLTGMTLSTLDLRGTKVSDLSLLGNPIVGNLLLIGTPVTDLGPLQNLKVTSLSLDVMADMDLTPLESPNIGRGSLNVKGELPAKSLEIIERLKRKGWHVTYPK